MEVTFPLMVMVFKFLAPLKASLPIFFTVLGIVTEVKTYQSQYINYPINTQQLYTESIFRHYEVFMDTGISKTSIFQKEQRKRRHRYSSPMSSSKLYSPWDFTSSKLI